MNDETLALGDGLETATDVESGTSETQNETDTSNDEIVSLDQPEATETEAEEVEGVSDGEAEQTSDAEYATIEVDGQEFQVPAAIEDGYMRNADYTRKQQANAETRRQLEAREAELTQRAEATEAELQTRASLQNVQAELERYNALTDEDWLALEQDDTAHHHTRRMMQLRDAHQQLSVELNQAQNQRMEQAQLDETKRLEATEKHAKTIPGWTQDTHLKIVEFAESKGVTKDTLRARITPEYYDILHLAWVGSQSLANRAKANTAKAKLEPLKRVSAKSSGTHHGDPASMSMDDYAQYASAKYKD